MSWSDIDLGRPQYDPYLFSAPLALQDSFHFDCAGCGDCCRSRKDLILSGYDLWRICRRLNLPPAVVVRGYCRRTAGAESYLPVLRVQPQPGEQHNCPFLHKGRCSIHEAVPLACALYPLMQQIDTETGMVEYFIQTIECGQHGDDCTAEQYLQSNGVLQRQPIDVAWAVGCTLLSRKAAELAPRLAAPQYKMMQHTLFRLLYLSFDWQQPYLPQLEQALQTAHDYLNKVANRQEQGSTSVLREVEV